MEINKNLKGGKIPVAVLGGTGAVGQRFIKLLANHPWFEIAAVTGSERTVGGLYGEVCRWVLDEDPPENVRGLRVQPSEPNLPAKIVFSALPSRIAKEVEPRFAHQGYSVCSNASAYRQETGVPLIIPEVNADHLEMLGKQRESQGWEGLIITSPNCTTTGLAMTLKPLHIAFGVKQVFVTTLQAVSGAGYPGVPYLDIADNLIPYIPGEEEKVINETRLLLGGLDGAVRIPAEIGISAQVNRVPVIDGHTLSIAVKCHKTPSVEDAIQVLASYQGSEVTRNLPSSPNKPIIVRVEPDRPQPRRDRTAGNGMAVTVGRIRPCPILDLRMVCVVHNTLRGAASGAIMNAELLVESGYV
jgi:aspartate-semialdehyde dehydrogenase